MSSRSGLNINGGLMTKMVPMTKITPAVILNSLRRCLRKMAAVTMVLKGAEKIKVKASPKGMNKTQLKPKMIKRAPKIPWNTIKARSLVGLGPILGHKERPLILQMLPMTNTCTRLRINSVSE
eukprot:13094.XXX_817779_818147_1 [CDS] Oithona nana genome sequencing.